MLPHAEVEQAPEVKDEVEAVEETDQANDEVRIPPQKVITNAAIPPSQTSTFRNS